MATSSSSSCILFLIIFVFVVTWQPSVVSTQTAPHKHWCSRCMLSLLQLLASRRYVIKQQSSTVTCASSLYVTTPENTRWFNCVSFCFHIPQFSSLMHADVSELWLRTDVSRGKTQINVLQDNPHCYCKTWICLNINKCTRPVTHCMSRISNFMSSKHASKVALIFFPLLLLFLLISNNKLWAHHSETMR